MVVHMDGTWYNNSALVGLIGVFLGAVLSFLGTVYSEYAKLKTLKREQEFKNREKREAVYKHFLEAIKRLENLMVEFHEEENEEKKKKFHGELDEMRMDFPLILAEVDLYADGEISTKCRNLFFTRHNVYRAPQKFQEDYDQLVDAMKESLKAN